MHANTHAQAWAVITPGGRVLIHTVATHSASTREAFRGYMGLHSWAAAKANGYKLERVEVCRKISHAPGVAAATAAPADVALIVSAVANHFGVTPEQVFSRDIRANVSKARYVSVWLSSKLTDHSPSEIARIFHRVYALTRNARRYVQARSETEPKFAAVVAHLETSFFRLNNSELVFRNSPQVSAEMRAAV